MFYHRPIDDPYHGGSRHCQSFAEGLRRSFPVRFIGPSLLHRPRDSSRDRGSVRLTVVGYLLAGMFNALRYVIADGFRRPSDRARLVVSFDVYLAGLAAIWAKVRAIDFVYYPQDSGRAVAEGWNALRIKGAILLRVVRGVSERLALRAARVILLPSSSMEDEYRRHGIPESKLRFWPLKRNLPRFSSESVKSWRDNLDMAGRIGAVFVGSFQYPPNVRAFEFLRSRVAPDLLERDPRLLLIVAGLDSEPYAINLPPNLRVLGTVEDLDGLLYACSIGLAPMDVIGGTSGKIVDFLLHGLPTVATPEAAQGVAPSSSLVIAPKTEFSSAILKLVDRALDREVLASGPEPDSEYVRLYTSYADVDPISVELDRRDGLSTA